MDIGSRSPPPKKKQQERGRRWQHRTLLSELNRIRLNIRQGPAAARPNMRESGGEPWRNSPLREGGGRDIECCFLSPLFLRVRDRCGKCFTFFSRRPLLLPPQHRNPKQETSVAAFDPHYSSRRSECPPAHECVDRAASIFSLYFSPFGIAAAGPCYRPPPPPPSRAKSSIFRAHLSTGDVQPRVLGTEDGGQRFPDSIALYKENVG